MEDLRTIKKALKGDTSAFEALVKKYDSRVYYICLEITKNTADAEDAAQESFIKAYGYLGRFRGDSAFSTWMYSIARNSALDVIRRRKETVNIDEQAELPGETLEFDPEGSAVSKESANTLKKLILALPEDFRQVLILREIEGCQYSEIAEMLGIGEGTVKSRLSRARSKLREAITNSGL